MSLDLAAHTGNSLEQVVSEAADHGWLRLGYLWVTDSLLNYEPKQRALR